MEDEVVGPSGVKSVLTALLLEETKAQRQPVPKTFY